MMPHPIADTSADDNAASTADSTTTDAALRTPPPRSRWALRATIILLITGAAFGLAMVGRLRNLRSDEGFHGPQIWDFYRGHWVVRHYTTMIPTYHAVVALTAKLLGGYMDAKLRVITLVGGLTVPLAAWKHGRYAAATEGGTKTLQTFFFPALFPFFFLIYTDVWCVGAVLGLTYFALRKRLILASICALIAMALRQDSVLWVGFAWLLTVLNGVERPYLWKPLLRGVARTWPLLLAGLAFVVFVIVNKGVAVGDRKAHQAGLAVTNLYSLLIWSWVLFLPQNLRALPAIGRLLRRRPWILLLLGAAFTLYMFTYANKHPYNSNDMRDWIHNELLFWMDRGAKYRVAFFVPLAWSGLMMAVTPFPQRRMYWLLPVGAFYACMHPLVEPRYYLSALVLFQLWRAPLSAIWEDVILLYGIIVSVIVFYLSVAGLTFL